MALIGRSVVVAAVSTVARMQNAKDDLYFHKAKRIIPEFVKVSRVKHRKVDVDNYLMHCEGIDIEHTQPAKRLQGKITVGHIYARIRG